MQASLLDALEQPWSDSNHFSTSIISSPPSSLLLSEALTTDAMDPPLELESSYCHGTVGTVEQGIGGSISEVTRQKTDGYNTVEKYSNGRSSQCASLAPNTSDTPERARPALLTASDIDYILSSLTPDTRQTTPHDSPTSNIEMNTGSFDMLSLGLLDNLVTLDSFLPMSIACPAPSQPQPIPILGNVLCNTSAIHVMKGMGVELKYTELWSRLHDLTNEMIVSTKGRQLFPPIEVTISDLQPLQKYAAWLKFDCDDMRGSGWRWSEQGGWQLLRKIRRSSSVQFQGLSHPEFGQEYYALPGGPFTGEQIMNEGLSFAYVKITNKPNTKGAIYIESFHSYVPEVHLAPVPDQLPNPELSQYRDPGQSNYPPSAVCPANDVLRYPLPLCRFIACTAYHNKELAQIKILTNPQTRGTRVLGNITPDLAKEFVTGELATETDIGKHKEQFLRRCASMSTGAQLKTDNNTGVGGPLALQQNIYDFGSANMLPQFTSQLSQMPRPHLQPAPPFPSQDFRASNNACPLVQKGSTHQDPYSSLASFSPTQSYSDRLFLSAPTTRRPVMQAVPTLASLACPLPGRQEETSWRHGLMGQTKK